MSIMQMVFIFCCYLVSTSLLFANIEVTFPITKKLNKTTIERKLLLEQVVYDSLDPVRINGLLVYHSGKRYNEGHLHNVKSFNELKKGMTLKEIVMLLGPGSQNTEDSGIGFINWKCEDGRILNVWPSQQLNEKAKYHISLRGRNQRHQEIKKITMALITSLDIVNQKALVTLAVDTHQAKANQAKAYEVGNTFQKTEPLPRIDFTITSIEGDSVHCNYFYQAKPEGLLHYNENGKLILHKKQDSEK